MRAGDAFVAGRSPETARALLASAYRLGLDAAVVRTTDGGYVVPEEVLDELGNAPGIAVEEAEGPGEVEVTDETGLEAEKDALAAGGSHETPPLQQHEGFGQAVEAHTGEVRQYDGSEAPKAAEEIADELEQQEQESAFDVDAASYPQLRSEAARRGLLSTGTAEEIRARLRGETEGE